MALRAGGRREFYLPPTALHLPPVKHSIVADRPESGSKVADKTAICHPTFPHHTTTSLPLVALGQVNNNLKYITKKALIHRHIHMKTRIYAQHAKQVPPATHTPKSERAPHA